ncbi:Plasmid replication initiator protein [Variovorax sp. NFACC28]|nr:Plasmid replication initiator protein [Variovorax sp. NFACC28]SEG69949.1 Plasmid replication initiator protein [Variovorax sp. NFACC29]SFC83554.1 Plasmid replication initiator protein [Variovorax sp. NFACC26]SFF97906.1 Plasmid replication initiator protein [Variovorax sp. NFACC27]
MSKRMNEREQLSLFRALPHDGMALRDAQDLMAYPFFSLAKSPRIVPIRFEAGGISLTVEGVPEHGIATIWDADVLIWAASQIIQAKKEGIPPSRLMVATPYEILRFAQRSTGRSDYLALRAALDRLQSTTVATTLRQRERPNGGKRVHRFSWINEWKEYIRPDGRSDGIELILADWFFTGVMDEALVLTLDPTYFRLSGGIERWLYRLVRKHGGRQPNGWRFEMRHLYLKSGALQRSRDFAAHVRGLALRQALPGYRLSVERRGGIEWLAFHPCTDNSPQTDLSTSRVDRDLSTASVEEPVDFMGTGSVDHRRGTRVITGATIGGSPAQNSPQPAPSNGFGPP